MERAKAVLGLLPIRKGRILDAGCGEGIIARFLIDRGFDVYGMDVSAEAVKRCVERGIKTKNGDLQRGIPFDDKFDVIICLEVLEHLVDPIKAIQNLKRSLKDNGYLILSAPNEFHILRRLNMLIGRVDFSSYDWHHLRFFSITSFKKMLIDSSLDIIKAKFLPPCGTDFFLIPRSLLFFISTKAPSLFALSQIYLCAPKRE